MKNNKPPAFAGGFVFDGYRCADREWPFGKGLAACSPLWPCDAGAGHKNENAARESGILG